MKKSHDITGQRFGRLVALSQVTSGSRAKWRCICDCGATKDIVKPNLKNGTTKSCGCLNRELAKIRNSTHGHTRGYVSTKIYMIWSNMKRRCLDPSNNRYDRYGGRGIKVCERWLHSFENFLEDMGEPLPGHSLDRTDNDGDYSPENCRWVCRSDQMKNRRNAVLITHNGKTQNLVDWAKETGLKEDTISARIYRHGWSVEDALTVLPHRGIAYRNRSCKHP
jgi:hypothetical protein